MSSETPRVLNLAEKADRSESATFDVGKSKTDHEARQDLRALIYSPRLVKPIPEDKHKKRMKIALGPKNQIETSLKEMEEELKASDIGQLLLRGGLLVVPVADYIKDKYNLMSVETIERLEKELVSMHQKLIGMGFNEGEIRHAITGGKKPGKKQKESNVDPKEAAKNAFREKYEKYQKFRDEDAEIKVKTVLETLNLHGLIIRSVVKKDVWSKCSQLYEKAGIGINANKDLMKDEYDLQMVFADGDKLNWILVEVKNKSIYPWDSTETPQCVSRKQWDIVHKQLEKGWIQLRKSFTFISELFVDIPFGKVFVFTAMPSMSRHVLEKELKPECMEMIWCQEDIIDPNELRSRLEVDKVAPATEIAKNLLCIVASRLIGPGSGLYRDFRLGTSNRAPADVRTHEEKHLNEEMEKVDNNALMILGEIQKDGLDKAKSEGKRIIVIEGSPGSGKTLTGLLILRMMIEKAKKGTGEAPLVIITKRFEFGAITPLRKQLEANAHGGQVIEWEKLLEENKVDRVEVGKRFNTPEELVALGKKLQGEQGGKRIIIMMDEAICSYAPKDKEQASFNWTGLDKIPDQLTLILMFNPGSYGGRHLLLPSSCLRLGLETTYRSTKSIGNLYSCVASTIKHNAPPGNPGTEVVGDLPRMVVLGDLGKEEEAEKIRHGLKLMRSSMGKEAVTVIIDDHRYLSDNIAALVRKEAGAWGWTIETMFDMIGAEADRVVYIGHGNLESISR